MTLATEQVIWSKSQVASLRECRRKHFFQRASTPADVSRLKKLTNRFLWSGSIVHETIGELLKTLRQGQPLPSQETVLGQVRERMREEFKASAKEPEPGKKLFEHEYGIRVTAEAWQAQWSNVEKSLSRFLSSSWLARLTELGPECWKAVDEILSFDVDGIKAYVKIDCAIESDGGFSLIDWKTSAVRPGDDANLQVAALYAHEVWGADPASITAMAVSLLNGQTLKAQVNEDSLMETFLKIQEEAAVLESAVVGSVDDPFALPMAERLEICGRCNFQRLCHPRGVGL